MRRRMPHVLVRVHVHVLHEHWHRTRAPSGAAVSPTR